jgi:beta-hydroxylase
LPSLQEIAPQGDLTTDDGWKTYFLYAFGYKSESNCRRCPETARLLEQIPGLKTAFFSILAPNKHIPRHRGAYKGLIRVHLGLLVPEPIEACRMELDGEIVHWEEGQLVIFDNTRHHEVWNDTDDRRVVLLFDIVRPLAFPASAINSMVLRLIGWSGYIREARRKHALWEKQFETAGAY